MAFVLGEEKRANPIPSRISLAMIESSVEFSLRRIKKNSPKVVTVIPKEATIRGSILSESLPAKGEHTTITMGCAIKINPAF
jgi:hypothetical protein